MTRQTTTPGLEPDPEQPALTPARITRAAVHLAERDGPKALTLRRLGQELGVDGTAFYRHFQDKDALVLAVGDFVTEWMFEQIEARTNAEMSWQDQLRLHAAVAWEASQTYPAVVSMTFSRTTGQLAERRHVETILGLVESLGLPRDTSVLVYRMIADVILALSGVNGEILSMEPRLREKDASAWSRIYAVQTEHEFPAIRRHVSELVQTTDKHIFDFTVDVLITGIEKIVADRR